LFGGGTPSPLRRAFLKLKLLQLERGQQRERKDRRGKATFEVIEGGKGGGASKPSGNRNKGGRGPDGQWLN
jgi:hypothetical protein